MAATVAQLARVLADQPFLSDVPPTVLRQLAAHVRRRDYLAGEVLFVEGESADRFFLIRRGLVRLSMQLPGDAPADVEILGTDAALGWSWLLPPYRWHLTATALKKTSTLVFDASRLRAVMEEDPAIGYELMRRFAAIIFDRLRALHAQVGSQAESTARRR
jgi:CRP/FNR family transcriptional regulator, cyclic AMP receptor protein